MDRRAWKVAVHRVTKRWTLLSAELAHTGIVNNILGSLELIIFLWRVLLFFFFSLYWRVTNCSPLTWMGPLYALWIRVCGRPQVLLTATSHLTSLFTVDCCLWSGSTRGLISGEVLAPKMWPEWYFSWYFILILLKDQGLLSTRVRLRGQHLLALSELGCFWIFFCLQRPCSFKPLIFCLVLM